MATYNILGYDSTNNLTVLPSSSDTANVQGNLTVAGNQVVTGDLTVNGTTTTINSQITTADDFIHMNSAYTNTAAAADSGFTFTVEPLGTAVASTGFISGNTVESSGGFGTGSGFAAGDIIQISGANSPENNGLYEAYLLNANQIQFRAAGAITASLVDIVQPVSFTNESDTGATVVRVKVMQMKTDQANDTFVYKYGSTASNMSADQTFGGSVALTDITAGTGNASLTTGTGDITVGVDTGQALKFQINSADKLVFDASNIKVKADNNLYFEAGAMNVTALTLAGGGTVAQFDLLFINSSQQMSPASARSTLDGTRGHQVVGVAMEAGSAAPATGVIAVDVGQIVPMNFGADLTSGDTGKAAYLSTTNGRATVTAPSSTGDKVVRVGYVWNGSSNEGTTGIHLVMFQPQFITEIV